MNIYCVDDGSNSGVFTYRKLWRSGCFRANGVDKRARSRVALALAHAMLQRPDSASPSHRNRAQRNRSNLIEIDSKLAAMIDPIHGKIGDKHGNVRHVSERDGRHAVARLR